MSNHSKSRTSHKKPANRVKNLPFDKYEYYQNSVQSPEQDCEFLFQAYKDARGSDPKVMQEDFCAAFALCCEWTKLNDQTLAIGIDLDPEPLNYGTSNYLSKLTPPQRLRVTTILGDVMKAHDHPRPDIICALNFSYMCFKKRQMLLDYFKACYKNLAQDGILVVDCFGGGDTQSPNEHETEYESFSYYWDQDSFNPLTYEAQFYIHYKRPGEAKRLQVFSYDWRLWTLAELKDLFEEAGFRNTTVYWEGTDREGDGNGIFKPTLTGEDCESWVAYMVASK